jgi:hypothetical protein
MVPPSVPTLPVSTLRKNRQRATIQPPRFPAAAARQVWALNREPAPATARATSTTVAAGTPDSASARSGVYSA